MGLLGKPKKIGREEQGHKGFDYDDLILRLSNHFDVIKVEGIPFNYLPRSLNFTIGIVLKTKAESKI